MTAVCLSTFGVGRAVEDAAGMNCPNCGHGTALHTTAWGCTVNMCLLPDDPAYCGCTYRFNAATSTSGTVANAPFDGAA